MNFYYNNTWKFIIEKLSGDIHKGLSEESVPKRREAYGDNKIKLPLGSGGIFSYIKELISIYLFIYLFIYRYISFSEQKLCTSIICYYYIVLKYFLKVVKYLPEEEASGIFTKYKLHNCFCT
ncbi:cation-transporting P-type ATPase [Clostridium paraputrificum]|uniref:cation-transporting P-type ATPase n=1 Tax=Clostridium paraputrificum TaxID=29363 RepID=UPI002481563A|nr:cation-transporting P-type ATPase [Clostridium paraputrificum]MDB2086652.1 cation-transporting P-type ATPase [Clostridium paraputrificum]